MTELIFNNNNHHQSLLVPYFSNKKVYDSDRKIITRVSGVKFDDRQDLNLMEGFWRNLVDQVAFVNYNPWETVYEREPVKVE